MPDPRQHRHVRAVDGNRLRYTCGCVNEIVEPHGAMRSVFKCSSHRARMREPEWLTEAYYAELGVIRDGRLLPTRHVAELEEALGPFPKVKDNDSAFEVGCGVSPYVPAIREAGWTYMGMDPSYWAAKWMWEHYGEWCAFWCRIENLQADGQCGFILAAHSLEHVEDMPGAIAKLASMLTPGGEFWIVIPDDSDPTNPDHLWFVHESSLRACLELAGLTVETLTARRIVPHENFLYCRARKPG